MSYLHSKTFTVCALFPCLLLSCVSGLVGRIVSCGRYFRSSVRYPVVPSFRASFRDIEAICLVQPVLAKNYVCRLWCDKYQSAAARRQTERAHRRRNDVDMIHNRGHTAEIYQPAPARGPIFHPCPLARGGGRVDQLRRPFVYLQFRADNSGNSE